MFKLNTGNSITLCIISIFKNEAHILNEWINHYIKEGVDMFFLIDNGSTDNYLYILNPYIKQGKVILNINNTKHQQVNLYNKYYLNISKKYDWVMVIDLDEFVYSRNNFKTIKNYLKSLHSNINQVFIPWKMFGSSGHIIQPNSVINSFTLRFNYAAEKQINCKCITRGKVLNFINIHYSDINVSSGKITSDGLLKQGILENANISEQILLNSNLHLNHYAIQSLEFFKSVKMTRGDNCNKSMDTIRNLNYFNAYDYKDTIDNELKNKT